MMTTVIGREAPHLTTGQPSSRQQKEGAYTLKVFNGVLDYGSSVNIELIELFQ